MGEKMVAGGLRTHPSMLSARLVKLGAFRVAGVPAISGLHTSRRKSSKKSTSRKAAPRAKAQSTGTALAARMGNLKKAQLALKKKRAAAKKAGDG